METWRETATFWSHRALASAAPKVPERLGRAVAITVGSLAYRALANARRDVAANQARMLGLGADHPHVRRATRDAFRLYARYWHETFRLPTLPPAILRAQVETDLRPLDAALARGNGCLVAAPHVGNWDVGGHFLAANGYRVAAVAEDLRPPRLAKLFRRHRERLGMHIVALDDPRRARAEIVRLLADNWVVTLLADRAVTGRGISVDMFGAARAIAVGPALIARTTGTTLLVGAVHTTTKGWRISFTAPLAITAGGDMRDDVTALARRVATELERAIAVNPADWHLFQPGWHGADARQTAPLPGPS